MTTTRTETQPSRGVVRARRARSRVLFRSEIARLLTLAGPIIVSQLGQVGMSTTDTIMVGPLGATPLAAAGLGSALHWLVIVVCMGTLVGLSPLVSQAWGARDVARARRVLVQGLWLAFLLSIPTTIVSLFGREFAVAIGQDPGVSLLTGGYLRALAWGILPFLLFMAVRQYVEGMGYVRAPMVITFVGLAVNVAANRMFIYGAGDLIPPMGVVGSGYATTLVRWTMLAAIGVHVFVHPQLRPHRADGWRPVTSTIRRILVVGLPIGGQFGLEVGLFSFGAIMMGWLGPIELAAHQVTINIASTTFMVALGVSMAGSIRVGHHIGARRPRRMRRATLATYLLSTGFMSLCGLAFVLAPEALIGLYTRDPDIVRLGATLLLVAAAFQMFDGAQVAGVSVLRGAGDTRVPAAIAAIGYWGMGVPVALTLAFGFDLGPVGVWIGLTAGLLVAALLLAWRCRRVLWHTPLHRLQAGGEAGH